MAVVCGYLPPAAILRKGNARCALAKTLAKLTKALALVYSLRDDKHPRGDKRHHCLHFHFDVYDFTFEAAGAMYLLYLPAALLRCNEAGVKNYKIPSVTGRSAPYFLVFKRSPLSAQSENGPRFRIPPDAAQRNPCIHGHFSARSRGGRRPEPHPDHRFSRPGQKAETGNG